MPVNIPNQQFFYKTVGRKVRQEREKRGLTQEALGSLVSLTRASVTNIENGRQKILLHTLIGLAAALKVSASDLLPSPESNLISDIDEQQFPEDLSEREREWIKSIVAK